MKYINLLTALFLILVLVGCSEDEAPTNPNIPENEKLNSRSAELYNQGVDVVEAAKTIKREFSFEDNILLILTGLILYQNKKDISIKPASIALSIYIAGIIAYHLLPKTSFWNSFVRVVL